MDRDTEGDRELCIKLFRARGIFNIGWRCAITILNKESWTIWQEPFSLKKGKIVKLVCDCKDNNYYPGNAIKEIVKEKYERKPWETS